jgi:hypothetical protein
MGLDMSREEVEEIIFSSPLRFNNILINVPKLD